jgi:hypothetical protein
MRNDRLTKIINGQLSSFDNAFKSTDGNRLCTVVSDYDLPAVRVPPFLVTTFWPTIRKPLRLNTRMTSLALQTG